MAWYGERRRHIEAARTTINRRTQQKQIGRNLPFYVVFIKQSNSQNRTDIGVLRYISREDSFDEMVAFNVIPYKKARELYNKTRTVKDVENLINILR